MSGDFSLLKYFNSFCEIKNKVATDRNLKQCGPFGNFEFVIYTNLKLESKSLLQRGDSDPLSILSSGTDEGKYITFDETRDKDIFGFFEELQKYHELIKELDSLLKGGTSVDEDIILKIEYFQSSIQNNGILAKLDILKSNLNKDYLTSMINEVSKCDFTLFKEFLSKVKIFQNQSNEIIMKWVTEKELQKACKASYSVANFIYTYFQEGFTKWWEEKGNVVWLNENSELWQAVQKNIISEIREISKPEIQEIVRYGIRFNEKHIQKLSDAIQQNTVLNIVTTSSIHILQKLKTYQALKNCGYMNSLFIDIKSLVNKRKEINKLWPCKWSDVMVVDCVPDGNVAHIVFDILQKSADCGQDLDIYDKNTLENLDDVLQKCQQKYVLISTLQKTSGYQEKLRNISYFEDNCDISDFDEESQQQIVERPVNFQGTNVALSTLVGTNPPESMKPLLDSDVISILLSNEDELSVGRQLCDHPKYSVPRTLQHQIYLKEDILKLTDYTVTFAFSGLLVGDLKKYLPAGEKIYEFVYDERGRSHNFKTVSDFSKTGSSAECGTLKTHQKVGQEMKSDDVKYNIFWNKNRENNVSENSYTNSFSTHAKFSKYYLSKKMENMKSYNEAEQNIKPEEVRYIILGNKNPDSEFRELKELCRNVHWIHVKDGSFIWRDTNGNIDSIYRYMDNTNCEKYCMEKVMKHNDRTTLLVADPGMGKSTFLSYMAHEIKKRKPWVWVLRINLNEHANELENNEFKQENIDNCKKFLWSAAHSPEQDGWKVTKEIFLQALKKTGKMVIILDGFDELSQENRRKVKMLIRSITDETASKIWISSRFPYRQELEDIVGKIAFTLQPFTTENKVQFLKQYWNEVTGISNRGYLQNFAERLIGLCSQNFSDKDGEFTGIPLQTMMLGEAYINEDTDYCCNGELRLPEKLNLLSLFKKFTEKKFDIYFREKNKMDPSIPEVESSKKYSLDRHMISALLYLFSPNEISELFRTKNESSLTETKFFLRQDEAIKFGLIRDYTDGKPDFIHQCFAEYLAAKWFVDNFLKCKEFISIFFFKSTYQGLRNIFDRMLAENYEIHDSVLDNDVHALKELLKKKTNINTLDKGGRTALHLAASYNSPCIQQLLSFPGIDANIPDAVLKWTPLKYADRTESWMAMDILLQNGANPDDIVFTRQNAKAQERGQAAFWECASKGHIKLMEFLLKCGINVNTSVEDPKNLHEKYTLLHRATHYVQEEAGSLIFKRDVDINIRDANKNTALHKAAESGNVDIIKLLLDNEMSVNITNADEFTPLHISAQFGHLDATKTLVARGAAIKSTNKYGNTPLMVAAYSGKLEILCYLMGLGADINIRDANNNTVLHLASASDSVDIINLLLDKGMCVNLTNTDEFTPLHVSAERGHLEATKTLVERGADINIRDANNNTALHLAAVAGNVDIIKLLLDKGMRVNLTNTDEFTPLHISAQFGHFEATKTLVERGADINILDANNNTALHLAAAAGNVDIIKLLLDKGMCVNLNNTDEFTPLHVSAERGHLEATKTLVERGADINIRDTNNNTALHLAAAAGNVDIIKLLLGKGMSVNMTNTDEFTPLHISAQFGHLEATKALVERGADINIRDANNNTALHYAAASGIVDIIKLLLDKGMSCNLTNTDEFTPLHISAQFGHLEATKALVERGAGINSTNEYGATALMVAAQNGKLEIFRYLTEIGADINIRDANKKSALHYAAASGIVDIIKILLDKGMSVNLTDTDEFTPLHISAQFGHLKATKTLAERGAAINNTNKNGDTPLTLATRKSHFEVYLYLKQIGAINNIHDA